MSALFQRLEENENFQRLVAEARAGRRLLRIAGLASGAKALTLAALQRATGRRLVVVSLRDSDLEDLEQDLRFFYCHLNGRAECENEIFILPASESDPYSGASPHAEILERRALALWRLTAGAGDIVMLTARSLMRRFVAVEEIKQATVALRVGEELPLDYLIEHLASPLIVWALGLPAKATEAFMVGFLRRDYGAAGLYVLAKTGQMDHVQILVSLVTMTLFVPCIAQFLVTVKERGWKTAVLMAAFIFPFAILVGGILNFLLRFLRISL